MRRYLLKTLATLSVFMFCAVSGAVSDRREETCAGILDPEALLESAIAKEYPHQAQFFLKFDINTRLEGSAAHGGLQPDYLIDIDHPEFNQLRTYVASLKNRANLNYWEKIFDLTLFIQYYVFPNRDYYDPHYRNLTKIYRETQRPIPLSEYVKIRAGVCRENAIVLHFALNWLGVPNRFLYVHTTQIYPENDPGGEDHAVVVVLLEGELRVVDSYNFKSYASHKLSVLLGSGVWQSDVTEHQDGVYLGQRFDRINPYPQILPSETPLTLPTNIRSN